MGGIRFDGFGGRILIMLRCMVFQSGFLVKLSSFAWFYEFSKSGIGS